MPPPQKFFSILSLKMATFSASWVLAHAARGGGVATPAPLVSASVSFSVHNVTVVHVHSVHVWKLSQLIVVCVIITDSLMNVISSMPDCIIFVRVKK